MRTFKLTLDVKDQRRLDKQGTFVQGDVETYALEVSLTNGGEPVVLDDVEVDLIFSKMDRTIFAQSTDESESKVFIESDVIHAVVDPRAYGEYGNLTLEVLVRDDSETLMTTQPAGFWVRVPLLSNETVESMDEYPLLLGFIQQEEGRVEAEEGRVIAEGERERAEDARELAERGREALATTLEDTFLDVTITEGANW